MKKILTFILFLGFFAQLSAQRFGYVDTKYILENMPQYERAQNHLKFKSEEWQAEVDEKQEALDKKRSDFEIEKVLLTEEQIKKQEEEIEKDAEELKEFREKIYGPDGELTKLRRALVRPLQNQIWRAVKEVAEKRTYGFVFDKGSDLIMIYTDPKYDISQEVLNLLRSNKIQEEN